MRLLHFFALGLSVALPSARARADDWPQFRGPNGAGLAAESRLPTEWAADKNVKWKAEIPGAGWSSPVVWGNRVFVTTAVTANQQKPRRGMYGGPGGGPPGGRPAGPPDGRPKGNPPDARPKGGPPGGGPGRFGGRDPKPPDAVYRFEVYCLDRETGKVTWKQVAAERKPAVATQPSNTYASETPVTDGERLYAYFGMHGVYCFDLNGKPLWNKDLGAYKMQMGWGTGSSPALADGRVYIQCDNEEKSFLVALDGKSGDELWRVNRTEKSSYSTPFIWRTKERTEVVACGDGRVRSYDPATGKQIWELGGVSGAFNASPVADADLLYVGTSSPRGSGPLFAIRAGASGDITLKDGQTSNESVAWSRAQAAPRMASPLLYDGHLYVAEQQGGLISCYNAKTGEPAYRRERLPQARGFTSSPWANDGRVFVLDEDGRTFVLQAGPQFKLLATNKVDEMFWSTPAAAGGALFLRGVDHLYCVKE